MLALTRNLLPMQEQEIGPSKEKQLVQAEAQARLRQSGYGESAARFVRFSRRRSHAAGPRIELRSETNRSETHQ